MYRKHGAISGNNMNISGSSVASYIPGILNRLDALESAVRNTTSPISPMSTNLSNHSPSIARHNESARPIAGMSLFLAHCLHLQTKYYTVPQDNHARQMSLEGYKFRVDPATNASGELTISLEMAVQWIRGMQLLPSQFSYN